MQHSRAISNSSKFRPYKQKTHKLHFGLLARGTVSNDVDEGGQDVVAANAAKYKGD